MADDKNRAIWDAVEKTDPKYTKTVNQRGGFTAIDPMYTIQRATEQFGPVGQGWGYDVHYGRVPHGEGALGVTAEVTVWVEKRENCFGPVMAFNWIIDPNNTKRTDDDAPKKAMTDALAKALSHLGFSADVFLGKFDDNKYLAERKQEAKAEAPAEKPKELTTDEVAKLFTQVEEFIKNVNETKDEAGLNAYLKSGAKWLKYLEEINPDWYEKIKGAVTLVRDGYKREAAHDQNDGE